MPITHVPHNYRPLLEQHGGIHVVTKWCQPQGHVESKFAIPRSRIFFMTLWLTGKTPLQRMFACFILGKEAKDGLDANLYHKPCA
jgi:hypothetical protein